MAPAPRHYREVFFAHAGPGPYSCFFCGIEVAFEDVLVHHEDEDKDNNAPENLKPAHNACHARHHLWGDGDSELRLAGVRASLIHNNVAPEIVAKRAEGNKKRWASYTPEEREARKQGLRDAWVRRRRKAA